MLILHIAADGWAELPRLHDVSCGDEGIEKQSKYNLRSGVFIHFMSLALEACFFQHCRGCLAQ